MVIFRLLANSFVDVFFPARSVQGVICNFLALVKRCSVMTRIMKQTYFVDKYYMFANKESMKESLNDPLERVSKFV